MEEEGQEGPIQCIFLCKFHPKIGPVILCQHPENYISKEVFEAIHNYLIPKPQIKKRTITISVFGHKISGYPNEIKNKKYLRNAFLFNLCFVCDSKSRSVQYEPVVKKLSEHLENLEYEFGYLSNEENESKLSQILAQILNDLNEKGKCTLKISLHNVPLLERRLSRSEKKPEIDYGKVHSSKQDRRYIHSERLSSRTSKKSLNESKEKSESNTFGTVEPYVSVLNLKQLVGIRRDPSQVQDHHVPILVCSKNEATRVKEEWDLTTQEILDFIDGRSHIAKIAAEADVHNSLVKECVQNLLYYRVVKLLPIFQYSNMYTTAPGLHELYIDKEMQEECLRSVTSNKNLNRLPTLANVMQMYSSLTYGVSVRDLCLQFKPQTLNIDEQKLIQHGVLHSFIRRLHHYPVLMNVKDSEDPNSEPIGSFYTMCNGLHTIDEICCKFAISYQEVKNRLESDPNVIIILK